MFVETAICLSRHIDIAMQRQKMLQGDILVPQCYRSYQTKAAKDCLFHVGNRHEKCLSTHFSRGIADGITAIRLDRQAWEATIRDTMNTGSTSPA